MDALTPAAITFGTLVVGMVSSRRPAIVGPPELAVIQHAAREQCVKDGGVNGSKHVVGEVGGRGSHTPAPLPNGYGKIVVHHAAVPSGGVRISSVTAPSTTSAEHMAANVNASVTLRMPTACPAVLAKWGASLSAAVAARTRAV
jgi:hypothetical protein